MHQTEGLVLPHLHIDQAANDVLTHKFFGFNGIGLWLFIAAAKTRCADAAQVKDKFSHGSATACPQASDPLSTTQTSSIELGQSPA